MSGQWPYSDICGIQPIQFNNFWVGTSYWIYAPSSLGKCQMTLTYVCVHNVTPTQLNKL